MKSYDLVFVTNCPSFYKINMFNEINKEIKVLVVFLGYLDVVIIDNNFEQHCQFDFKIVNKFNINKRSKIKTFFKLRKILKNINFKKILYGGYNYIEFIIFLYLIPKKKNILSTESAGETKLTGWRYLFKITILKRYSTVIVSGKIHEKMIRLMGYNGKIIISKGVGIIEKPSKNTYIRNPQKNEKLRFVFVGRLIDIKNVEFIVDVFNELDMPLTIVGNGVLMDHLKSIANDNIILLGFKNNKTLGSVYSQHDVFILPSLKEPWGLVIEEALYWGCTLLLSDRVGSVNELLIEPNTGVTFNPEDSHSLKTAIKNMIDNFDTYQNNVKNFDFAKKDKEQIQAHVNLVKL